MALGVGYDSRQALLVAVRDAVPSATEYEDCYRHMQSLDEAAFARGLVPICIMMALPGTPAPNAYWRKRYADLAMAGKCPDLVFALVTESTLQRGVLTAIQWLTGARGTNSAHSTFAGARVAAERRRRQLLPSLEDLLVTAQADLRASAAMLRSVG